MNYLKKVYWLGAPVCHGLFQLHGLKQETAKDGVAGLQSGTKI